jgi:hypothetical protein
VFTGVRAERLQAARTRDPAGVREQREQLPAESEDVAEQARRDGVLRKPMGDGRVLEIRIVS